MGKFVDLSGRQFGRWLVGNRSAKRSNGVTWWECSCSCGVTRAVDGASLRRGKSLGCGCARVETTIELAKLRSGEKNPRWKGGRFVTKKGYVDVRTGPPGERTGKLEHRLVMEAHLGRQLLPSEHVHHKNGIRDHNSIENLELKVSPHGAKISVSDAISWAKETLAIYCPEALKPVQYEYPSEECVWL